MNCERCKKYEDCKNGSGLTWPCGAYTSKNEVNCLKCHYCHPDNGNCTIVGGFCTSILAAYCPLIPELRTRAEAAETEVKKAEQCIEKIKTFLTLGRDTLVWNTIIEWEKNKN